MFKSIIKICSMVLVLGVTLLDANPLNQSKDVDGMQVIVRSAQSMVVGSNELFIEVSKDSKIISDLKILQIKVFMPEMPGMPYMESKANGELVDGKYKVVVNLAMGGTWQYQVRFKSADGTKHKVRGSLNI